MVIMVIVIIILIIIIIINTIIVIIVTLLNNVVKIGKDWDLQETTGWCTPTYQVRTAKRSSGPRRRDP